MTGSTSPSPRDAWAARIERGANCRRCSPAVSSQVSEHLRLYCIAISPIRSSPFPRARSSLRAFPEPRLVPLEGKGPCSAWATMAHSLRRRRVPRRPERQPAEPLLRRLPARERGSLATVLFTDLVGHTEMMSRLGDERGRAVLREHERITREVLKAHGGTEVKTMGDGFMASFGSCHESRRVRHRPAARLRRARGRAAVRPRRPQRRRADRGRRRSLRRDGDPGVADRGEGGGRGDPGRGHGARVVQRARGSCSRTAGSSWRRASRSRARVRGEVAGWLSRPFATARVPMATRIA